jgi:CRISPR-associated protein Cas1
MSTLYLSIPGSKLRLNAGRYRVEKKGEVLIDVPAEGVSEVILLGGTQITTQAMRHLLTHQARIHLMTQQERHIGTLEPSSSSRPDLLRAQVRRTDDPAFRLEVAKIIVAGKLENARTVLTRLQREHPNATLTAEAATFQRLTRETMQSVTTENEVRGLEGIAAQAYFAAVAEIVPADWRFTTRRRRPPPDPVNAMLSFGYTLVLGRVISALHTAGLHPGIGCLHVSHGARPALALDLMEEYRAAIIDRMVLRIVQRGQINPADFTSTEQGCRFGNTARDQFIRLFEARMRDQITHENTTQTYARVIRSQARNFAALIRGETSTYTPLRIR